MNVIDGSNYVESWSRFYLYCCCSNVIARIAMPTFVQFKMLVTGLYFETYFPQTSENDSSSELDILRNSKDIAMLICCIKVPLLKLFQ